MTPAAHLTQEWETSVVKLKDVLTTDETSLHVGASFMTKFYPATVSLLCYFLEQLLMGAHQQAVPRRCLEGYTRPAVSRVQSTCCANFPEVLTRDKVLGSLVITDSPLSLSPVLSVDIVQPITAVWRRCCAMLCNGQHLSAQGLEQNCVRDGMKANPASSL
jgi:hypothetical protein